MRPSPERFSFLLLFFLLTIRFSIFSAAAWNLTPRSDEIYYVSKAMSPEHHTRHRWRPSGYPTFLTYCAQMVGFWEAARVPCFLIQFFLIGLVLVSFLSIVSRALSNSWWLCLIAFMLGLQPWCFEDVRTMSPDSLTASLTTIGIIGLFGYIRKSKKTIDPLLILPTAILCLTAWMRAEMMIIVPILIAAAVFLKRLTNPVRSRDLVFFCLISCVLLIAAIFVRAHFVTSLALLPRKVPRHGAMNWTRTWFSTEKTAYKNFLHLTNFVSVDIRDFPNRAFADDLERSEIAKALKLLKIRKTYDREVDRIFQAVANKRSKQNFFVNRVLTKIWRTLQLWLYFDSSNRLLSVSGFPQRFFARMILAGFYVMKITIYLLAVYSCYRVLKNLQEGPLVWYRQLTALMLLCVIVRTLLMGTVLDWTIHRYALIAWPAMLWCATSGIIDIIFLQQNRLRASALTSLRA